MRAWKVLLVGFMVVNSGDFSTFVNEALAQNDRTSAKCSNHEALFEGFRDARLRLRSGVYRGSGYRLLGSTPEGPLEGDVSFYCAFDYLNSRLRWEREDPTIITDFGTQEFSVAPIGYLLVRTPKYALYHDDTAGVGPRDILRIAEPDFEPPSYGKPFDVRTFGLMEWGAIERGTTFQDALKSLDRVEVLGSREGPGGACIVTLLPHKEVKLDIWINSDRGYTIEHTETRYYDKETNAWGDVNSFGDITWEEHGDVWVPTSISLEKSTNGRETKYYATLDWEYVNEEPPATLFEPDGLGLDPDGILMDTRLGDSPIAVGRIKDGGRPPSIPDELRVPAKRSRSFVLWLIVGNAVAIVLIATFYWRIHRR